MDKQINQRFTRKQRIEVRIVEHAKKYEGRMPNVYLDPKGIPTIGYGYALGDKNGNLKSTEQINKEMNVNLNTEGKVYFNQSDLDKLKDAESNADIKGVGPTLTDGEMNKMITSHVKEHTEKVDRHIESLGKKSDDFTDAELAAFTDLSIRGGDNLIGSKSKKLNEAIKKGDRDAILYEIEEGSNGDNLPGNDIRMKELGDNIRKDLKERNIEVKPRKDSPLPEKLDLPDLSSDKGGSDDGGGLGKSGKSAGDGEGSSGDDSSMFDGMFDGIGGALGEVGGALMAGGKMVFSVAMSVGQQVVGSAVQHAIASGGQGGGKAVIRQAAKATLGQMLGNIQAKGMAILQEKDDPFNGGFTGQHGKAFDMPKRTVGAIEKHHGRREKQ